MRVLFLGNSFTNRNQMPEILKCFFERKTGDTLDYTAFTSAACTLEKHEKSADVRAALRSGGFDAVVLQEQSQLPVSSPFAMFDAAVSLSQMARSGSPDCRIVLFQTWARKDADHGDQAAINEAYAGLAEEISGSVVSPAGIAFAEARSKDPKLKLHDKDKSHPSKQGSYLAAACLFATISGDSPAGLPLSVKDPNSATEPLMQMDDKTGALLLAACASALRGGSGGEGGGGGGGGSMMGGGGSLNAKGMKLSKASGARQGGKGRGGSGGQDLESLALRAGAGISSSKGDDNYGEPGGAEPAKAAGAKAAGSASDEPVGKMKKGSLGRMATGGKVEAEKLSGSRKKKFDVREGSTLGSMSELDDLFGDVGEFKIDRPVAAPPPPKPRAPSPEPMFTAAGVAGGRAAHAQAMLAQLQSSGGGGGGGGGGGMALAAPVAVKDEGKDASDSDDDGGAFLVADDGDDQVVFDDDDDDDDDDEDEDDDGLPSPELLAELNVWLAEHRKRALAAIADAASSVDADAAATNCESHEDEVMLIQSMHGEDAFCDLRQGPGDSSNAGSSGADEGAPTPNEAVLDECGSCAAEVALHEFSCKIVSGDSGDEDEGGSSVTLGFTLPSAYPSHVPPLFVLDGVPLDCVKAAMLHLEKVFEEECKPDSIGCLFQWTEWLRECLQEDSWPEAEEEECDVVFD